MISLIEGLKIYYGLDYLSFILGLIGILLLTNKKATGFLFSASSVLTASFVAIIASQYGFILANILSFILLIRGYIVWKKENKNSK